MWDARKTGVGPEEEFDFIRVDNADRQLRRAGPGLAAAAVGDRARFLGHVRAARQNGARRPTGARFWVQGHFCASKNGLGRVWAGKAHGVDLKLEVKG